MDTMMANKRISATTVLLLLSQQVMALPQAGEHCATIEDLGTSSLNRFNYSVSMDVDDNCEYTLVVNFKHDGSLPIPSDPIVQCDPYILPPDRASDGLPFFESRRFYEPFLDDIQRVTGMNHISIDWNPCGQSHPPVDQFECGAQQQYYDIHFYRESLEYRTCMTCHQLPGFPTICDPTPGAQITASGRAFFDISTVDGGTDTTANVQRSITYDQPSNMPKGYRVGIESMVPLMGGHAWDPQQVEFSNRDWVEPIWIMASFHGKILAYEPIIPISFLSGASNKNFTESLIYEGQTMTELPSMVTIQYMGATTGGTILTLKGSSADKSYCGKNTSDNADGTASSSSEDDQPTSADDSAGSLSRIHSVLFSFAVVIPSILL